MKGVLGGEVRGDPQVGKWEKQNIAFLTDF